MFHKSSNELKGSRLLDLKEMEAKGFSIPWLNRRRSDGRGGPPYFKLNPLIKNSPVRYDEADVDEWLAKRRFKNTAQAGEFQVG